MNTSLTAQGYKDIISSLDDLLELGKVLVKSGMLPQSVKNPEAAVAIMLKGREIGMPVMESFALINVIQGKPTIAPQGMLALIKRSGQQEDIQISDDGTTCTVTMKRKGESQHTASFSMEDAKAMGLAGKDNWIKQPKTMRQWRAIAACARVVFPDIIGGMYLPEEMGIAVNDDGEIVGRDTTGWTVDGVIAGLQKDDEQNHATVESESAQVSTDSMVIAPSGESEKKESPTTVVESVKPAEMIVVDSRGTEKPRRDTIGVKVASSDWFKSHILGHKHFLDKSNHPVQKHFTSYILKYFGINSAVNLTWEMFVAMRNNLDGKGDDPKYYKPEAKEIEPTEPKSIEDRIKDAGLSKLVAEWKASYHIRPDSDHRDFIEMVEIILEGIGNGHFSTSTPEGLKEIDEQFRVAFKEVPF